MMNTGEKRYLCECGYGSETTGNMSRHRKTCRTLKVIATARDDHERALADKDRVIAEKDEQIKWLRDQLAQSLKTPRTVTNNDNRTTHNNNQRYIVNQSVNVFGKESTDHITDEQLARLIDDPETAVAKLVRLKHSVPDNQNIRVPNKRERRYEVVVEEEGGEGGQKRWKSVDKSEVLAELWESNGLLLEGEVDEEDAGRGARFIRHQDRVRIRWTAPMAARSIASSWIRSTTP